ncbi:hypothetical protein [Rhodococcus sp. AH-ZY2]|uniref:hypothetical protein n=1 Tax=Rhodococcus sp. AH-ZY2 TaxID=3047468 RepID=UPI0027DEDBAC|nr:hypothetical protein [Rhodococcus sp. AH-ZY2]WML64762.1 hypothetical protein QNA09_08220 [Rhodococcus sp. AH-ZY2]
MTEPVTGIGPQKPQPDPRGILTFDYLPEHMQALEDARQAADYDDALHHRGPWTRPATDTERELLLHLGYELRDGLSTTVEYLTPGVRRRTWNLPEPTPQESAG